jgi:hypothetical protein
LKGLISLINCSRNPEWFISHSKASWVGHSDSEIMQLVPLGLIPQGIFDPAEATQ